MKNDELELLRAIRAGHAGPVTSLSPARHQSLLRRFERQGLIREGSLTDRGKRALERQSRESHVEKSAEHSEPERLVDERLSDVSDIQGQDGEDLDDPA